MTTAESPTWGLILAGGDGTRLQWLTARITGDTRPKQFCPILDGETPLERTRRRAELLSRPDCQVIVVTRAHARYYTGLRSELFPERLVVQPDNRGTAAGILYPLLRIAQLAGDVPVAIFPSDHHISDDGAFVEHVSAASTVVREHRRLIVLLGVEATAPEHEYGWIECGPLALAPGDRPVFPVRRFWEKPSPTMARALLRRGCLWNSFVTGGWVSSFLGLIEATVPDLLAAFALVRRVLGTSREAEAVEGLYARLPVRDFSKEVLARRPQSLAALVVKGVDWSDWGKPERVIASLVRAGQQPPWLAGLKGA